MRLVEALQETGLAQRKHKIRRNRPEVIIIRATSTDPKYIMVHPPHGPSRPIYNAEMGFYVDGFADWEPVE